jgi:Zn-dependent peptidase ImmA (M78 family)
MARVDSMDHLQKLYNKFTEDGIYLFTASTKGQKAVTICHDDSYGVFFSYDNFQDSEEEFLVLSHEYGHCATGCTHTLDSPFQLIAQHETRANRKAVHDFLPAEVLQFEITNGNTTLWQLSESLNLPEAFIKSALEIYKLEGKLS